MPARMVCTHFLYGSSKRLERNMGNFTCGRATTYSVIDKNWAKEYNQSIILGAKVIVLTKVYFSQLL